MKKSTPLYHRLKAEILKSIQNGIWQPGQLLPSGNGVSQTVSCQQNAVRQAIGDLASGGKSFCNKDAELLLQKDFNPSLPHASMALARNSWSEAIVQIFVYTP